MTPLAEEARAVWRARSLVWVLTRRDIATRNAGSAGGWLWSYAQPLLMVAAYYLVFDVVFAMRVGGTGPPAPSARSWSWVRCPGWLFATRSAGP